MIIRNCTIIDCTGRPPTMPRCGSRKAASGDRNGAKDDGPVLDGRRLSLPVLVNLHVHINRRHLSRCSGMFRQERPRWRILVTPSACYMTRNAWYELSRGVTTLRDLCSVGRTASELKSAINEGLIRGPRMVVCGLGIASTGGHETHRYAGAVEADGPDAVMQATREEIKRGADFIKLMVSGGLGGMPEHEHPGWTEFSIPEIAAACYAAHSHNRTVTVHAMGEEPVLNALKGGVDGIEHGASLTEEALDIMCERNVYYVPTMSGITAVADKEERSGSPELAAMMRELVVYPQRESVRKAHRRGVLIGAGSDTLGSVPEELLLMQECGMSALEALQTATINAAIILRWEDRLGTVEPGKLADLLIVEKNPLEDLRNLNLVRTVLLNGEIVSPSWM